MCKQTWVDEMQMLLQPTPAAPCSRGRTTLPAYACSKIPPDISLDKTGSGPFLICMVESITACFSAAGLQNHLKF